MLLEFPDATTRVEDVAERARTLTAAGASVTVVLAGAPRHGGGDGAPELPAAWRVAPAGDWRTLLHSVLAARPGTRVTWAGEDVPSDAAPACARLPGVAGVRGWPTRLCGDPDRDRAALATAVAARARGVSARSSLWDGDYLVVPAAYGGHAEPGVIEAFATIAPGQASLDLVFLGDRREPDARLARRLGVHSRVHWTGWAPLRAECAWLAGASAVLLGEPAAACAPLVLRSLASGTPVALAGNGAVSRNLAAWLARHEALAAVAPAAQEGAAHTLAHERAPRTNLAGSLGRLLTGGEPVKRACARAAALAAAHEWSVIAAAWRDSAAGGEAGVRAA